jgi:hypothetical protein
MTIQHAYDRLGFPLLRLPAVGVECHLLPLTKAQFECFLAEPQGLGDDWYQQVLAVNPRMSWRGIDPAKLEELFLTAVWPAEAGDFARWLGDGFVLPTPEQWRTIYQHLREQPVGRAELDQGLLASSQLNEVARAILVSLLAARPIRTWAELAMFESGLLDWVRDRRAEYGGLGAPRPAFFIHLLNPSHDAPVRPTRGQRPRCFGFRFVRACPGNG